MPVCESDTMDSRTTTLLLFFLCSTSAVHADVDYLRQVKPILERHCVKCHGAEKQESGLRLDVGGGLLRGGDGGAIVVAEKTEQSRLLMILRGRDDQIEQMPPEGQPLPAEEIAVIKAWIQEGARIPQTEQLIDTTSDHWSFQRPRRPELPPVRQRDAAKNPIDTFVLANLEADDLQPSRPAERTTLIRRASLDLIGLPPSVAEVDAFVNDVRPDAYERLV